jgi:pyruvate,water dikinase
MVGKEDADILLSNAGSRDEPLASLGPAVDLARVARGELSREVYLARWGHRGPLETETFLPRPAEDPVWLDEQLAALAQQPVDVEALLVERQAAFDAAWERCQASYPRRAKRLRRRLEDAAKAVRLREAVRSEYTRLV